MSGRVRQATVSGSTSPTSSARWLRAADAFEATAQALDRYSGTLRWAQGQAAEAIRLWDEGEEATRQARAAHDRSIADAEARNRANVAAGDPTVVTVAPFTDPDEQKRQAAQQILGTARQQSREAADWAAEVIQAQGDEAPEEPGWLESSVDAVGGFLGDVAVSAWESVTGSAEFVWDLVTNPGETIPSLVAGISAVVQDPIGFAKQTWTSFVEEPGRTIGNILGGGALKAGSLLGKVGRTGRGDEPDSDTDRTPDDKPDGGDRNLTVSEQRALGRWRTGR